MSFPAKGLAVSTTSSIGFGMTFGLKYRVMPLKNSVNGLVVASAVAEQGLSKKDFAEWNRNKFVVQMPSFVLVLDAQDASEPPAVRCSKNFGGVRVVDERVRLPGHHRRSRRS